MTSRKLHCKANFRAISAPNSSASSASSACILLVPPARHSPLSFLAKTATAPDFLFWKKQASKFIFIHPGGGGSHSVTPTSVGSVKLLTPSLIDRASNQESLSARALCKIESQENCCLSNLIRFLEFQIASIM
ncbi:hypothetical protein FRX31_012161 [Thalictrum thalictroides]|uniref:Uncharacterized protein n=1 Tax=Thalictrum thalictroides TaxID=46969 RepID=A0A7J6WQ48_THATH|nr:hypothetical protein FRX31_012161 [Thalictrum thalictroides]